MNQIINMIMRQLTRKLVNKGIDAGLSKASSLRGPKSVPQGEIDDYGKPVQSRADVRQQRQAKQQARQARQAVKVLSRSAKF